MTLTATAKSVSVLLFYYLIAYSRVTCSIAEKSELATDPKLFFEGGDRPQLIRARPGQKLVLDCQSGGSPSPSIHWLFRGSRIPQGHATSVLDDETSYESKVDDGRQVSLRLGSTRSRLFIDCVTPGHVGDYTCVAETPYKRITQTRILKMDRMSAENAPESCMRKRLEGGGKPARIFMWTKNRLEFVGGNVQLYCRAAGTPKPKISWEDRNGNRIKPHSRQYTLLQNGDVLIERITFLENMGVYKCVAENKYGMDEISTFLYPTSMGKKRLR